MVAENAAGVYAIGRQTNGDLLVHVHGQSGVAAIKNHTNGDFIHHIPVVHPSGYASLHENLFQQICGRTLDGNDIESCDMAA